MSGTAFEGLEHIASPPAGEDYRASERGFEMQFVRGLIEKVEAMSWDEVEECFTEVGFLRSVAIHYAALKACPADSFEGQTLLDAAVWIGGELLSPEKLERLPPTLLDPLVQALYLLGKNSFRIDTTSLSRNPPVAAGWLTGSKSHPLELTYLVNTDVVRFGTGVRHCRLTLSGVSSPYDDYEEKDPTSGKYIMVYQIGNQAVSTEFFVPFAEYVASDATDCRFYVTHEGSRPSLLVTLLQRQGFFTKGNSLLVPDSHGSWKEVRP